MKLNSVLVVDDSESDQFYANEMLDEYNEGVEIKVAYDGSEALAILEKLERPLDVIFLDLNMPGMNGFEFLEEYSQKEYASYPVVVLSSSEQALDKNKVNHYDCVKAFMVKPIDFDDFSEIEDLI